MIPAEIPDLSKLSLRELMELKTFDCSCDKRHQLNLQQVEIGCGAIERLPEILRQFGIRRPYLIADLTTWEVAAKNVGEILAKAGIGYSMFVFQSERPEPDESAVGLAAMAFDTGCDAILAVGSGSIGDISKVVARTSDRPLITIATAPSMDGFASPTGSMIMNGLKSTVPGVCPVAIIGDLDILTKAPARMLQAGLGDMLAKPVALCEWRISHLINDEYYCPNVAALMRRSAQKCFDSAEGLSRRDPSSTADILEGLILSGVAMTYAGITRPASGIEHYFSHIWDMKALQEHRMPDFHGIQVGIGTVQALRIYQEVLKIQPDVEKAQRYVREFDKVGWEAFLREFLPATAEEMIRRANQEARFDLAKHAIRLNKMTSHWHQIQQIIRDELPDLNSVQANLRMLGAPISPEEIGIDLLTQKKTFLATKDLRSKYMAGSLLWDLGMLDEIADRLY